MADNFYEIYLNQNLLSKDAVYQFLAEKINQKTELAEADILSKFRSRESKGNIQIAEQVVFPHFISGKADNSFIILRLQKPIKDWSETISDISLIIAMTAKDNLTSAEKQAFAHFIRRLASKDFLEDLLILNENELRSILNE
ncbi:PTS sugar transporter subunit IIA [Streptococcus chenjunshii]|uniref:PTS sugar transporter subunit IIA n=1 Tax=Streptococcus chenjunshii TaxID=2173853 RepID=A0A372KK71_9STRE|nr:PTS sugar transporter subunit IIA [Streptococcus chenjunshii]AXQ79266.1 PTS sugar transporter subunit IIA [Streptococcus chenjunshii]RFU50553.1 PTS sugar transporter subunit IIA [Streptococcus chenjunshii]RFU52396.1 PTS sugar transporter subunit IIA [Streptococcus chenjunshii]